ncbi:hypothetical protein LUZ60_004520 [Juncus effusus]|nr:hypothetical protein LUZ60_004520 [Juncus effusus]
MASPPKETSEILSPIPRSPSAILSDGQLRIATGGKAPTDAVASRHHLSTKDGFSEAINEPNGTNEDGHETNSPQSLDEYKSSITTIISEYFTTGDVQSAASDLNELGFEEYHPLFIKKLISMSMDRHDKQKEMASVLLSSLYNDILTPTDIKLGFLMLLEASDDLAVDIPNVVDLLAVFISRAIIDEIVPPVFVSKARDSLLEDSMGIAVLQIVEKKYISVPHCAEFVAGKFGGTSYKSVEEVKEKIRVLLSEFLESGDSEEACRCVRELGLPFFHHEVVKRALTLIVENPKSEEKILKFLEQTLEECLISTNQMTKGFFRISENIEDLSLDVPSAKSTFNRLVEKAVSQNWIDPNFQNPNPNFSNGDSNPNKLTLKRYKDEISNIIQEYFLSDDIPELIRSLEELNAPQYKPFFIKKLITLALDRKNREKEMASVLLSSLSMELFNSEEIVKGFVMLLRSAQDISLDILNAQNELALFLARAVIDEVLVPFNLEEISKKLGSDSSASETVRLARQLASARHAGERILRCWGGGTGWQVEDAKDKIQKLLEEYFSGGDLGEACQCVRELGLPFFNHEVVKKAIVMGVERKKDGLVAELLERGFEEGLITVDQMSEGFSRVRVSLEDLRLDVPDCEEKFEGFVKVAKENGWVLEGF